MAERDQEFRPLYAVAPGETLEEVLADRGITQTELARRMGRPLKTINEIIQAKAAITAETAIQLERVLGIPVEFWTNLERQYREDRARIKEIDSLREQASWVERFPLKDLQRKGLLPVTRDRPTLLHYLLRFFGVASIDAWRSVWLQPAAAFRSSAAFRASEEGTAAWLRAGAVEAGAVDCPPYNEAAFLAHLQSARSMTRLDPEEFHKPLADGCRRSGVVLILLRPFDGTRAYGATQWVRPEKAVIQLSNRHKTDDHFWFTFFHEAGHLVRHGHKETFVEGPEADGDQLDMREHEANEFGSSILFPADSWQRFTGTHPSTLTSVTRFADELNISPGIVVGRLQHEGAWPFSQGNGLKRHFALVEQS